MSFEKLNLCPAILRAISYKGYTEPTPVQQQAIPAVLEGNDALVIAQTGTGKTAAFVLPLLEKIAPKDNAEPKGRPAIRALILTPTRELAAQVMDSVRDYSKHLKVKPMAVYGGVRIYPQVAKLRSGVDVLIATPGRLIDLIDQGVVNLSTVEFFVLDEADRMLDMGFIQDIKKLLKLLPKTRQSLLFSATFSSKMQELAGSLLQSPVTIEVKSETVSTDKIRQVVHPVDHARKRELLSFMIGNENWQQVLVFVRTKRGADKLAKQLDDDGLPTATIHGDKTQAARSRALQSFKTNRVRVLVATDVAARGIDIKSLPHVVNYDLPDAAEDYVHRIGRTGRANSEGVAISLVCVDEFNILRGIERLIKKEITQEVIPGYEPDPSIRSKPFVRKRGGGGRSGGYSSRSSEQRRSGSSSGFGGKRYGQRSDDSSGSSFRKPYRERSSDSSSSSFRKPYSERSSDSSSSGFRKPYRERSSDSSGSSFRKPYRERSSDSSGSSFRKPYGDRSSNASGSSFKKPYSERSSSNGSNPRSNFSSSYQGNFENKKKRSSDD